MCGIVAAISKKNVIHILVEGLKRLEYRGYDSCGFAILQNNNLIRARTTQRVVDLEKQSQSMVSNSGIAHTRWATHGKPETQNAHPHFSFDIIAVVHNGIIENYEELRDLLIEHSYNFISQTDTEVIAHLIHYLYVTTAKFNLELAVKLAIPKLKGTYAIAIMSKNEPEILIGVKFGSPLIIGLGKNENFFVSDILAVSEHVQEVIYLEDGDIGVIRCDQVKITNSSSQFLEREKKSITNNVIFADKGVYKHFMQKEIFEQPCAISDTLSNIKNLGGHLFGIDDKILKKFKGILILACGTSYYAGLTAKYWIESIAKIPVQVEIASEYRYRDTVTNTRNLIVVISQSGETADTLSALRHAKNFGYSSLAICNVITSTIIREASYYFLTHAGIEISVASTKAFTTQLTALYLLALSLSKIHQRIDSQREQTSLYQLRHLPLAMRAVLLLEPQIISWSEIFSKCEHILFLGRGMHYPIALEGALKLKEISYIHAEAYPAGELKHGPLALITQEIPVVVVAPNDILLEKLKSNMQEVKARCGRLYVFADADTHITSSDGIHVIRMPEYYGDLSPILHVLPLQLLAYHTACMRGTEVDKPRNLAKSVTVE